MQIRSIHRIVTFFVVIFTLYLGVTGTLIQLVDFSTIATSASPFNPNMRAMREDFDGPAGYKVIRDADYLAPPLPQGSDLDAMFATTLKAAQSRLAGAPMSYVEVRMANGKPVGEVQSGIPIYRFDATTGQAIGLAPPPPRELGPPASLRNTFKHLHRMTVFGTDALWINVIVAVGLVVLIITGLWVYVKLVVSRTRLDRRGLFWQGGGWWRMLHRWTSVIAALFLAVATLSGGWLAVESLVFGYYLDSHPFKLGEPPPPTPVPANQVMALAQTTIAAYQHGPTGVPPRVVRLRVFGTMLQGVVVTGEDTAHQLVYNAETGQRVSETEPGYPEVGFPFGWQAHQTAKAIHRGSFFGLTGRFADLIAGLAMIYLSVSGFVMYWDMWQKRRRAGRKALVWS